MAILVPGCCFVDARRVVTRSQTQGGRPAALANINQVLARQQQQIRLCSCVISARREKHEICKGNHEAINNHCVTSSVIKEKCVHRLRLIFVDRQSKAGCLASPCRTLEKSFAPPLPSMPPLSDTIEQSGQRFPKWLCLLIDSKGGYGTPTTGIEANGWKKSRPGLWQRPLQRCGSAISVLFTAALARSIPLLPRLLDSEFI